MIDDYYVKPLSNQEIEEKAYAWREALGIPAFCECPDIVSIIENEFPKLDPSFALIVEAACALDNVEAYTAFDPPKIVVRENVYVAARSMDGRARWTFAHELGHLVLHHTAVPLHRAPEKYRSIAGVKPFASAEKQADKFAASFLMPAWIASEYSEPAELARSCGVSYLAAKIRLEKIGSTIQRKLPTEVIASLTRDKN